VDLGVCFRARANRPKTVSTAWILAISAFAYLELLVCLAVWLSLNVALVALRLYVTSDRRSRKLSALSDIRGSSTRLTASRLFDAVYFVVQEESGKTTNANLANPSCRFDKRVNNAAKPIRR
jgi:hypothetical protein